MLLVVALVLLTFIGLYLGFRRYLPLGQSKCEQETLLWIVLGSAKTRNHFINGQQIQGNTLWLMLCTASISVLMGFIRIFCVGIGLLGRAVSTQPSLVIMNGPGTCLPVALAAVLGELISRRRCKLIYVESFGCVKHLSLTGKLLLPIVDRFLVHWPTLKYSDANKAGRLWKTFLQGRIDVVPGLGGLLIGS